MNSVKNHSSGNFTIIPNALIEDETLSDRARFLYIFLIQKPQDWTFRTRHLSKSLGMHTDTFRKYRNELCKKGWIKVEEQKFIEGRYTSKIYHLYGEPVTSNEEQILDNSDPQNERNIPPQKNLDSEKNGDSKTPTPNNTNSLQKSKNEEIKKGSLKDPKNSSYQNPNPRRL